MTHAETVRGHERIGGIVLAAGAGSRYGKPKILVDDWLERSVAALVDGGCHEVFVVTGAARPPMHQGVIEIHNPDWSDGIGSSLRRGLDFAGSNWACLVIHLVDCPDIGADVVSRVLLSEEPLARATFNGLPGHPVKILGPLIQTVRSRVNGDIGAGPILKELGVTSIECGDLASGIDIDYALEREHTATR